MNLGQQGKGPWAQYQPTSLTLLRERGGLAGLGLALVTQQEAWYPLKCSKVQLRNCSKRNPAPLLPLSPTHQKIAHLPPGTMNLLLYSSKEI